MMSELKNITHGFSSSRMILDSISIELEKGKIYGLMGANSSGKTTLFNISTGFVKPPLGDVFFKSNRITGLPPHKINRLGVSRTFQDLRSISKLTVKENIILAMKDNPTQAWYRAVLPEYFYNSQLDSLDKRAKEIIAECFLQNVQYSLAGEISNRGLINVFLPY